jgi:glutaredoxin-related protein
MKAIIYTKENCTYCQKAKQLFDSKQIEYQELLIGRDITREQVLEQLPHAKTLPQIWLDNSYIGGFNELSAFFTK